MLPSSQSRCAISNLKQRSAMLSLADNEHTVEHSTSVLLNFHA